MENILRIDCEYVTRTLVKFLQDNFKEQGFKKGVIGLSGGLDSTVSAYLSTKALGNQNVIGVLMPYKTSSKDSVIDAMEVVNILGIKHYKIDITPMVDAFFEYFPDADKVRRGNKMARERMCVLYDVSQSKNALVIGTSNKSEILLGYGTLHGDTASAINPLSNLYKTQIKELARYLGVPGKIRTKIPSAGLWKNQSDEDELGFKYTDADKILYLIYDKDKSVNEVVKTGFSRDLVMKIINMVEKYQFKRRGTITAKIFDK